MTTLFVFLLGIALITLIARYNESNKLFWSLFVCYVLGFAGAKLVYDNLRIVNESKTTVTQALQPIQGLTVSSGSLLYLLADEDALATKESAPNPVGQVNAPERNCKITSSGRQVTGDTGFKLFPNPPNKPEIVDDS